MPNIITHILFTDDVYEKLDDPKYDFLESRLQLMEVGGNGPDFLFFHNLNPTSFMKKTPLRKIGNEVHSHSINDFYASAVASIQKEKRSRNSSGYDDIYLWSPLPLGIG